MKNFWILGIISLILFSCHKEEPFDFSYTAKPKRIDVFRHLEFECQSVNSPSSFIGTVDDRDYCLLDTNLTDTHSNMFTLIGTTDPTINPNGDSNAVCSAFFFKMIPKEYKAGNFELIFSYYSDGLQGYTKEGFLREYFIPGLNLPLSTYFTTSPPYAAGLEGAEISLIVYDGFPDVKRGISFTTSDIVQPDDAYVTCTRSEKIGSQYFIELDVNLQLPHGSRYENEPEPEMKSIKGKYVLQIEL